MHMEIKQNITLHQYSCTRLYCQCNAWYILQSSMIKVNHQYIDNTSEYVLLNFTFVGKNKKCHTVNLHDI
jgi:hypothetical protein